MRLCKDCKHFSPTMSDDGKCTHPEVSWIHPVTGEARAAMALNQRIGGRCGRTGQLWEYVDAYPLTEEGETE